MILTGRFLKSNFWGWMAKKTNYSWVGIVARRVLGVGALGCAVLAVPLVAFGASDYPNRPITLIVPFPAGGGGDITFRLIGERLRARLNQTVIIENRAGASGNIGFAAGVRAAPDGYTLTGLAAPVVINPVTMKGPVVDPTRDLVAIGGVSTYYLAIVVAANSPLKSVADLVAAARARPDEITYASLGGSVELSKLMFETAGNFRFNTIRYKGTSEQMRALLGGEVMATGVPLRLAMPFVKEGRIRVIGHYGPTRNAVLPDVQPIAEVLPGVSIGSWLGLAAPLNTPREIVQILNAALNAILKEPAVHEKLVDSGDELMAGSPEDFAERMRKDLRSYRELAQKAKIVAE